MERAIFAGGCFWCMIQPFDELEGVQSIFSGYTAGHTVDPTYEEVKVIKPVIQRLLRSF